MRLGNSTLQDLKMEIKPGSTAAACRLHADSPTIVADAPCRLKCCAFHGADQFEGCKNDLPTPPD